MGQSMSCAPTHEHGFFRAIQLGDLKTVEALLMKDPSLLYETTVFERLSALHLSAINGRIQVLSFILDQFVNPDILNRYKQTPLMLAVMHGKISCVKKLLEAGANILMFDSINGRTCLHYAAYYGHSDCLQALLSAAQSSPIAESWGFTRFVNIRDGNGATPLHLAARQRRPDCVHILLTSGSLVCASTGTQGFPGSTPLHMAARGGSLDCIRELLAWGADRIYRDALGYIPYMIAIKHRHGACAALLNPTSAEPIVWPSPLKFISELKPDAKVLLEGALMDANKEREKKILKGTAYSVSSSPAYSDGADDTSSEEGSEAELCNICFDQACTIEVQSCGHQMCAHCTLSLCCHNKPNPITGFAPTPLCPFCRSVILRLVVVKLECDEKELDIDANVSKQRKSSRKSKNFNEGSSSFKSLSAVGSFGRMGARNSGRVAAESTELMDDKP